MSAKYFSLVLHSHIPYVLTHGSWPHGMDWLYEAAAETYLPLLRVFERLQEEGLPARINISFTPVLMEQLKSPSFAGGFKEYLKMKVEIARGDLVYFEKTGLFGHWWFEGPEWLYLVLKKLHLAEVKPQTASRSLEALQPHSLISLPEGSWGTGGFHWIWLNEGTAWIWEKIYSIEKLAMKLRSSSPAKGNRILKQFIREKFLLESSDWPFLISTWTARDYSENRAAEHYLRAKTLADWLQRDAPLIPAETKLLETWEEEDSLFSEVVIPDGRIV
jgi:predicted glycosyl hydrolase (DUF1957 family)